MRRRGPGVRSAARPGSALKQEPAGDGRRDGQDVERDIGRAVAIRIALRAPGTGPGGHDAPLPRRTATAEGGIADEGEGVNGVRLSLFRQGDTPLTTAPVATTRRVVKLAPSRMRSTS